MSSIPPLFSSRTPSPEIPKLDFNDISTNNNETIPSESPKDSGSESPVTPTSPHQVCLSAKIVSLSPRDTPTRTIKTTSSPPPHKLRVSFSPRLDKYQTPVVCSGDCRNCQERCCTAAMQTLNLSDGEEPPQITSRNIHYSYSQARRLNTLHLSDEPASHSSPPKPPLHLSEGDKPM